MINYLDMRINNALENLRLNLPEKEVKAIGALFKEQQQIISDAVLTVDAAIMTYDENFHIVKEGLIALKNRMKDRLTS